MDWSKDKLGGDRAPRLGDKAPQLDLPDGGDFKEVRMIGPSKRVAKHMLPVFKQDGTAVMKNGQQVKIPKVCLAYNHKTNEYEGKCPYCDIDPATPKVEVHTNVIDRELANDFNAKKYKKLRSKKESKKREMEGVDGEWNIADGMASKKLTPVRYWVIKSSVGGKISDYTALNKKKNKEGKTKVYGPSHEKYGFDMNVKFDKSKAGSEMYSCVKADRTELSEEELDYLLWDVNTDAPEDMKTAKKEAESFAKRMKAGAKAAGESDDDDDDDDDKKKSKSKKSKGKKNDAEDDDWNEDDDFEDDDDDKKSKKSKSKSKSKKSKDDDEDDDSDDDADSDDEEDDDSESDDDDDDDDDDDKPKKKKGKDKKSKKSKKSKDDDDDDDDEEDDDDDRPSKKSKKSSKKSKKDDWDDEDEDDDDSDDDEDEDDDDDDDVKKKKKSKDKKSKKSSKKSRDDDDDDDDEDEDDEDDEDEKPAKKKSKDKSSKKSKKKSKKSDDDDDDSDDSDDWDD